MKIGPDTTISARPPFCSSLSIVLRLDHPSAMVNILISIIFPPSIPQMIKDAVKSPATVFHQTLVRGCDENMLDVLRSCNRVAARMPEKVEACEKATAALHRCLEANDVIERTLAAAPTPAMDDRHDH